MLKTTHYQITDKTGHYSHIGITSYRKSTDQPWDKSAIGPSLSTVLWSVHISRKQAAEVLLHVRSTDPVWQAKIEKNISVFGEDS
jgi:hypothetical protein